MYPKQNILFLSHQYSQKNKALQVKLSNTYRKFIVEMQTKQKPQE
jgi:hypothetical protein